MLEIVLGQDHCVRYELIIEHAVKYNQFQFLPHLKPLIAFLFFNENKSPCNLKYFFFSPCPVEFRNENPKIFINDEKISVQIPEKFLDSEYTN